MDGKLAELLSSKGCAQSLKVKLASSGKQSSSGSILGPILLNIFINYSDNRTEGTISKFVYNYKLGEEVEGRTILHRAIDIDINRLEDWANKNYMRLTKRNIKSFTWGGNPKL